MAPGSLSRARCSERTRGRLVEPVGVDCSLSICSAVSATRSAVASSSASMPSTRSPGCAASTWGEPKPVARRMSLLAGVPIITDT